MQFQKNLKIESVFFTKFKIKKPFKNYFLFQNFLKFLVMIFNLLLSMYWNISNSFFFILKFLQFLKIKKKFLTGIDQSQSLLLKNIFLKFSFPVPNFPQIFKIFPHFLLIRGFLFSFFLFEIHWKLRVFL